MKSTEESNNNSLYRFGDFIITIIDETHISIKTDNGFLVMEPKAGNSVAIISTKAKRARRKCLLDVTKDCNLCHKCDKDILNPTY